MVVEWEALLAAPKAMRCTIEKASEVVSVSFYNRIHRALQPNGWQRGVGTERLATRHWNRKAGNADSSVRCLVRMKQCACLAVTELELVVIPL